MSGQGGSAVAIPATDLRRGTWARSLWGVIAAVTLVIAPALTASAAYGAPLSDVAAAHAVVTAKGGGGSGGGGGGGGGKGNGGGGGTGGGSTERAVASVGDSYAAGTGAGSYLDTTCYRSSKSYPKLIDATSTFALVSFPACSGAATGDVLAQLGTIAGTATIVTVTVGGNDVGFASVMQNCFVLPNSSCASRIQAGADIATSTTFKDALGSVLDTARGSANRTVVVTGYPLLFWENSSGLNPKYSWADEVNDQTVVLNGVIAEVARLHGAIFVDAATPFAGHGIGSSQPWINDWNWLNSTGAFHPNASGYAAYSTAVQAAIPAG